MTKRWFPKHKMKTFEWIIFKNPLKAWELHPMGAPSVHPSAEWKPCHITNLRAGPRIFGLIISKSTQRLGACGGQISPGSTRRQEGLARGFGLVTSQGHPFGTELLAEWANTRKKQTQAQATRQTRALSVAPTRLSRVQRPWISGQIRNKSARL
jgi:hypothetical protein